MALSNMMKNQTFNDAMNKLGVRLNWNSETASHYAKAMKTGLETLVTVIDWTTVKPVINSTPQFDQNKLKIIETWGVEEGVKILQTPVRTELAIKLVTGTYDGPNANILNKEMPFAKDQLPHIFRDAEGHMKDDTPENRQKLFDTVENDNCIGTEPFGNDWYAKNFVDGTQGWVRARNDEVTDGGLNPIPKEHKDIMPK